MGHGDVRSYSHNAPFQQDHNKLGTGELQKLRTFNTNQPSTFGAPGTTLGNRTGSRRNLGPGGNLVSRASGFDGMNRSTSSSHGKKEEKEQPSASTNAYR